MEIDSQRAAKRKILSFLAACLLLVGPAGAAQPIDAQLRDLVDSYRARSGARVGLSVRDAATGRPVAALAAGELLIPASCQKIVTAAVALARLGADYEFTTSVYLSGSDIVVVGDLDPTLGDPRLAGEAGESIYAELDRWAVVVREGLAGRTARDVLLARQDQPGRYRHPDWPAAQHRRWYAAPVASLNFHDNCLDVTFSVEASSVVASVAPQSRFISVQNRVKVGRKHVWSLRTARDEAVVVLTGSVSGPATDPLSVAIDNPPMLLGRVFADRLALAGVEIAGSVREVAMTQLDLGKARTVCQTRTPLSRALRRANKRSLNLAAEACFLRAGDGSWAGSAAVAQQVLRETYELGESAFVVRDGGGLSKRNRLAPAALTELLVKLLGRAGREEFLASLGVSGVDGTMRSRLASDSYRGRVLAKTGSLAGVSTLAGYVLGADGRPGLAFAVLINDVPAGKKRQAKNVQDAICRALVEAVE